MIPKKIHYCWFGRNKLPEKAVRCIESWKKYCSDYEIIEWSEDNYDIYQNPYTKYVYNNKKYAFLSDYARLQIILQEGGIYFDVDVEVVRSLDDLLIHNAFFGFVTEEYVNTGVGFGAEAGNSIVKNMLSEYDKLLDGESGTIGCPILNTATLKNYGLVQDGSKQVVEGAVIYPIQYFNPYDDPTGRLNITSETYSIHWFAKSWMSKRKRVRSQCTRILHRLFEAKLIKRNRR